MNQRCCIECREFDHATPRDEERSLVRCLAPANREGIWNKLVRAGQPACPHFAERGSADVR